MKKQGLEPIKISENTKGTFTTYCKSKGHDGVTCRCVKEGLGSVNPKTRKRANFALQFAHRECK